MQPDKKITHISRHRFASKDKLLFDANIWLALFRPSGTPPETWHEPYSRAFTSIKRCNIRIYINDIILSECVNVYLKKKLSKQAERHNFKAFRASADFKKIAEDIAEQANKILSHCQSISSIPHSVTDLRKIMAEYAAGGCDFNDQVIAKTCKANGLILVTHDGDFGNANLPLLTANQKMLARR